MLLTSHAARDPDTGAYTAAADAFLRDLARRLRLFHLLHWASHARRLRVLLTDAGLRRLADRGLLTPLERERLERLRTPEPRDSRHYAVLQATITACQGSIDDAAIMGLRKFDLGKLVLSEFCKLRGACTDVPDMADGRMPLAYAHFVQVLVDTFLAMTPIAKYADLGIYSALMVGILTFFYHGLLILAKVFLDPLDNEDYCEGCVYLDLAVLIRESNAASTEWIEGAAIV